MAGDSKFGFLAACPRQDELNESLDPVTGTIFKSGLQADRRFPLWVMRGPRHWCHARESEIRVDDLPMILADFGIEANQDACQAFSKVVQVPLQDCLDQALAGNIYATLVLS